MFLMFFVASADTNSGAELDPIEILSNSESKRSYAARSHRTAAHSHRTAAYSHCTAAHSDRTAAHSRRTAAHGHHTAAHSDRNGAPTGTALGPTIADDDDMDIRAAIRHLPMTTDTLKAVLRPGPVERVSAVFNGNGVRQTPFLDERQAILLVRGLSHPAHESQKL